MTPLPLSPPVFSSRFRVGFIHHRGRWRTTTTPLGQRSSDGVEVEQGRANLVASLRQVLDKWDRRWLVASPDVDGLLSAALLGHLTGARLAGFYDTRDVVRADGIRFRPADALWVDLDVQAPCVGQHVVNKIPGDLEWHGANPNVEAGRAWRDCFRGDTPGDKYPFGTVHWLLDCLNVRPPRKARPLLAHADGAWAACQQYPANAAWWAGRSGRHSKWLLRWNAPRHRRAHQRLVDDLVGLGVRPGATRASRPISSPWSGLHGTQSVPLQASVIAEVLDYIGGRTGWHIQPPSRLATWRTLRVTTIEPTAIGELPSFLKANSVFSHAFVSRSCLRYTTLGPAGARVM